MNKILSSVALSLTIHHIVIENCTNTGRIEAALYAGGIAVSEGSTEGKYFTAKGCSNTGEIVGKTNVGQILALGGSYSTAQWVIENCTGTGTLSAATVCWNENGELISA